MVRIGLFEKYGPLDIACTHCTVGWCKCNLLNCMGSFIVPSYNIMVVGVTTSCKPYISQEQIFMFYVCPDVMFSHYFVHCYFSWHHWCGNFFWCKTLGDIFLWYMDFCKCIINEHMLLSRKHFSHMLTCCIRESTQWLSVSSLTQIRLLNLQPTDLA
jgi:hypothetical protein